jgi:hypothetical protein
MRHGWLKDLWVGEALDRASGRKLFIDLFTDVIEISNVILEDTSNIAPTKIIAYGGHVC